MLKLDDVKQYLMSGQNPAILNLIDEIRIREYDNTILFFVPRDKIAEKVKPGFTSIRQIENLKSNLFKYFSCSVEYVLLHPDSHQALESGFFEILNRKFDHKVRSLIISFKNISTIDSWIELSDSDDHDKKAIEEYFEILLKDAKLKIGHINWIDIDTDLPSIPYILRMIKSQQPISLENLLQRSKVQYHAVNDRWMRSFLDSLRKKGLILWQRPGTYTVTYLALSLIPTSTQRSSSDIERALALGKKKW